MQALPNQASNNQSISQKSNIAVNTKKNSELEPSKSENSPLTPPDTAAIRRAKTNAATLQAHINISIGAKTNPMYLLLKTALEGINEALKASMGPDAAQKIHDSGVDVSPEATAGRIVSLSTAFFARYQEQNPDMELEEQIDNFLSIIGGGVDQGFAEAREILDGFGILEGGLESNINKTYDLIFEGFAKFRESLLDNAVEDSVPEEGQKAPSTPNTDT